MEVEHKGGSWWPCFRPSPLGMGGLRRSQQHVHVCPRATLVPWVFPTVWSKTELPTLLIVCGRTGFLTHFIEAVVNIPAVHQRLLPTVQTVQNSAKTPSLILLQSCGHPDQPLSLQVSPFHFERQLGRVDASQDS